MDSKSGVDALFLYATEGILITNDKGEIIRINPSAEKLFGYEKDELLKKKVEVLIPKRFSKHTDHREKYKVNPHPRSMGVGMELYGAKKDRSEFPVEISLSPYETPEGKFVVGFIIDITLRKQEEERRKNYAMELEKQVGSRTMILKEAVEELEKTKEDLKKALEKEKELNEMKSRFVSMASHEFRTPLATMMSSLFLVTKYGEQNDKINQSKHVTKIQNSIHNLTDILNDFLSISKLEEGKIENLPEELNLKVFLTEVISDMTQLTKEEQEIKLKFGGKEIVRLDQKLLKNVLFNLISNAIKFSPENKPIEITIEAQSATVKITIKDSGIGISKEDQKNLFERFFRGNNATHIQGTGLGLNIVSKYVELMNGAIHFESEENKGSTFTIILQQ